MKILYAGTPEIAVAPLNALAASEEVEVVGVLTRPNLARSGPVHRIGRGSGGRARAREGHRLSL